MGNRVDDGWWDTTGKGEREKGGSCCVEGDGDSMMEG